MRRLVLMRFTILAGLSLTGAFFYSQSAVAFSGTGYYSGGEVCTSTGGLRVRDCSIATPPYSNDVVPGRKGVINAIPDAATTSKAAFYSWLSGSNASWPSGSVVGDENAHKNAARRFIVDTMNGSKGNDMAGLKNKIDNPDISMATVTNINASTLGSISFYGMDVNNNFEMFYATWGGKATYTDSIATPMLVFYKDVNHNGAFEQKIDAAYYYIQIGCGNPVGQLPGLPNAENWTINGQSYIYLNGGGGQQGTITAHPGDTLTWNHDLRNNGPSNMSQNITYSVERHGGFTDPRYSDGNVTGTARGSNGQLFFTAYAPSWQYSAYGAIESDVGHTLCQYISWGPSSPSNSAWTQSASACARIASNYSLYPEVKVGGGTSGVVIIGGATDQQSSVENTAAKSDVNANYQSYEFVVPAGKTIDFSTVFKDQGNGRTFALAPGGADICKAWLSGQYPGLVDCKNTVSNGSTMFAAGTSSVDSSVINSAGYKTGDLICRLLWVDHYDYSHTASEERRVSMPACVRVAKTPYVQFWGGDVRVGDSIGGATTGLQANAYTSSNTISGKTFGSWAEYGIFAPTNGTIRSVSGGALSGKTGFAGTPAESDVASLSFANTTNPKGGWAAPANIASYESSLGLPDGGSTSAPSISLDSFASRGRVTLTNGSGTVHVSGTLPGGSLMLLYPTGTIVIDGNVTLGTNSYSSVANLSQVIIQAKNIVVTHDVDRIDAWLVAVAQNGSDGGVVSTCDTIVTPYYSGLTAKADSPCNQKPLRINGPVMGREVQLRRTFGADADNIPAEIINLRADTYLWTMQAANDGSIDTIFTTELPPRF